MLLQSLFYPMFITNSLTDEMYIYILKTSYKLTVPTLARSGNLEKDTKTQCSQTKSCKTTHNAKKTGSPENRAAKTGFYNSRDQTCKPAPRIKAMGNLDLEPFHYKRRNFKSIGLLY